MARKILVILFSLFPVVAIAALLAVMSMFAPKPPEATPEEIVPAVFFIEAEQAPVKLSVVTQGEVRPKTDITLTTQVGGKIKSVSDNFADGGAFEKGDLLVQIEPDDYEIAVISAEAELARAEQALRLEEAEAELAQRDWQELNKGKDPSEASPLTLRRPQLNQAKANYDAARANLNGAKLSLSRTKIRAPFNGRVRQKNADVGQFVSPGFQIGQIFSTDIAEIRLPMTDDDLTKLSLPLAFIGEGPSVDFSASVAGVTRHWFGKIVRTDAAINPTTRQISVIAEVKDPYGEGSDNGFPLAVGLFVTAEISGPEIPNAITLPAIAVQNDNTVYLVDDEDNVAQVDVTVAATSPRGVIVTSGVEIGDRVIVSRLGTAGVGTKVRPLPQAQRNAGTTSENEAN